MALPIDTPMAGYFIYRDTNQSGNPFDPAALEFYPAKDSDELFDALRAKYPHIKTHAERMRDAVIEFLIQERQAEQIPTPQTMSTSTTTSPCWASFPSLSSETSTLSSPETLGLATPTFTNSPPVPHLNRQFSAETSAAPSSEPSPPALDQMTGVFSLADSTQPKQRVRRKMTEAEKVEYRQRRIVKACEKCAKRKRKCHHNQPEMETMIPAKSSTHKIAKPAAASSKKQSMTVTQEPPPDPRADPMDFTSMFSVEMSEPQSFDDFTDVLDDPFPDMNFEDLLQFDQSKTFNQVDGPQQWPWSQTQDWTLMDSPTEAVTGDHLLRETKLEHDELDLPDGQLLLSNDVYGGMNQSQELVTQYPAYPTRVDLSKRAGGLQHTYGPTSGGDSSSGGSGNRMLWEHLRTGQPTERQQSTHTPHVHAAHGPNYVVDNSGTGYIGVKVPQCAKTSLAQMTLRLTGTAKAVRAFGNLLRQRSPAKKRIQTVALRKIAVLALAGLSVGQQHDSPRTNGFLLDATQTSGLVPESTTLSHALLHGSSFHGKQPKLETSDGLEWFDQYLEDSHPAQGPLEGMAINDYLRMRTCVEDTERRNPASSPSASEGGLSSAAESNSTQDGARNGIDPTSVPAIRRTQKEFGSTDLQQGVRSAELASISAPVSSGGLLHTDPTTQEGRSPHSLGEGITRSANPNVELYMLKRRIPKALHSIVDRDDGRVPIPLLQVEAPSDSQAGTAMSHNALRAEGSATSVAMGGEYLRANPLHCNHPDTVALPSLVATVAGGSAPTHTRPQNSTAAVSAEPTSQLDSSPSPSRTDNLNLIQARQLAESMSNTSGFLREQLVDLEEERLSDHVRRRDHFGRPAEPQRKAWARVLRFIAALGSLLFALLILSAAATTHFTANPTHILLALAVPVSTRASLPGSKRMYCCKLYHIGSRIWDALMLFTAWNSGRARRGLHQLSLRRKDLAMEARVERGGARELGTCLWWNRNGAC